MTEKERAETAKRLKKAISNEQRELERHINEYAEKYLNFLQDVIHKCELTGIVKRKRDGVEGELIVGKNNKFAFYEPYIIIFRPLCSYDPKEDIYNVLSVTTDFEKIERKNRRY